ncbi:hypothetical protein RCL1_007806 [Eukaryota sp. TZLM3-RCL]
MDGNGRWARKRGLPRSYGHEKGGKILSEIVQTVVDLNIPFCTLYAFSKENWKRSDEEIDFLRKSMLYYLTQDREAVLKENVRFKTIGHVSDFGQDVCKLLREAEEETRNKTGPTIILALSYSSRQEIVDSIKSIVARNQSPNEINTDSLGKYLYYPESGDVDLLIRTSGEQRLSNFLLWQCAYAELVFVKKFWPDFHKKDLLKCLYSYERRNRRFGNA